MADPSRGLAKPVSPATLRRRPRGRGVPHANAIAVHVFVVTNDFPPRIGGINYYVDQLMRRLP